MSERPPANADPPAQSATNPTTPQAVTAPAPEGALIACRPTAEVEQTADRLLEMTDTNGDGNISREEATSAASFLLGGSFFRADANDDGSVTPEEGRQVRAELMNQHPQIASLPEILAALRRQGVAALTEVGAVVLETDGSFSVIRRSSMIQASALHAVGRPERDRESPC
ncbi:MAG: YetF domain-containing protein [Byssovorax sp.]